MKSKPKRREFSNAIMYRLHNKRVIVEQIKDGLGFSFLSLNKQDLFLPHLFTNIQRGIRTTNFALSKEAAVALYLALQSQLTLNDIVDSGLMKDFEVVKKV